MPRQTDHEDDWDEEFDSDEDEGELDSSEDGDEEPTVPCPYCGREIHEESVRCTHCDIYISAEDAPTQGKPLWIVITALICLAAVYGWIVGF